MNKVVVLLVFTFVQNFNIQSQNSYFEKYKPLADSLSEVHSIPSSIILAVAYHESGGGTSQIAKLLNNHFGIKGKNDLLKTHKIKCSYKYYPSSEESYRGFCRLVTSKKYYEKLKGSDDVKKWVKSIAASGYAANAERWSNSILKVIYKFELNKKEEQPEG
jgi:flagellum-specific peptidoglycan hydrolase FlgJ